MRLPPVLAETPVNGQRHAKLRAAGGYAAHQFGRPLGGGPGIGGGGLKYQFIMHLQNQTGVQPRQFLISGHGQHSQFDDVRRRPLYDRVDGLASRQRESLAVGRMDVRQEAAAAAQGGDKAVFADVGLHLVVKSLKSRQTGKIPRNEGLGLQRAYVEIPRQFPRPHAVNQSEIDGFGATPLLCADFFRRGIVNERRCAGVYVLIVTKGVQQGGVLRHVGQHA